jgi:hypothetical protein
MLPGNSCQEKNKKLVSEKTTMVSRNVDGQEKE